MHNNNQNQMNQSPIVPVTLEKHDHRVQEKVQGGHHTQAPVQQPLNTQIQYNSNEISALNSQKRVVSTFVEITTKTIVTYDDGSTKETYDKQNHTYK